MNKRIEELAEQHALPTLDSVDHLTGDRYKMFLYTEEGMMDFAKSIVQECCDWLDGSPTTDAGQLLLSRSFIIACLKGHFGVEE